MPSQTKADALLSTVPTSSKVRTAKPSSAAAIFPSSSLIRSTPYKVSSAACFQRRNSRDISRGNPPPPVSHMRLSSFLDNLDNQKKRTRPLMNKNGKSDRETKRTKTTPAETRAQNVASLQELVVMVMPPPMPTYSIRNNGNSSNNSNNNIARIKNRNNYKTDSKNNCNTNNRSSNPNNDCVFDRTERQDANNQQMNGPHLRQSCKNTITIDTHETTGRKASTVPSFQSTFRERNMIASDNDHWHARFRRNENDSSIEMANLSSIVRDEKRYSFLQNVYQDSLIPTKDVNSIGPQDANQSICDKTRITTPILPLQSTVDVYDPNLSQHGRIIDTILSPIKRNNSIHSLINMRTNVEKASLNDDSLDYRRVSTDSSLDVSCSTDTTNSMLMTNTVIPSSSLGGSEENECTIPDNAVIYKTNTDWYDSDDLANMMEERAVSTKKDAEGGSQPTKLRNRKSKIGGINDNFVRLDLKNVAGSCRGARSNLKKVNKQKLWRARHRFRKSDVHMDTDDGCHSEHVSERSPQRHTCASKSERAEWGDLKCIAPVKNDGVDPLNDFIDGMFHITDGGVDGVSANNGILDSKHVPSTSGDRVPMCIRHHRPCKLLTVKNNNKGNKGRKFYVCSMPRGENCDFFKWEEDTIEATRRALLQSSSDSGFIARQVEASKSRLKDLTLPHLRMEAKKRGLNTKGKKDQLLTRLLIWVRDEISKSIIPDTEEEHTKLAFSSGRFLERPSQDTKNKENEDEGIDFSSISCQDIVEEREPDTVSTKVSNQSKVPEITGDVSTFDRDRDDQDSSCDELEICALEETCCDATSPSSLGEESTKSNINPSLHESLDTIFGYKVFREGQEWAINRCLSHKKTLFVAPTGQGKSLCYALPAVLMDGICLVVSPLISLIQDQLRQFPPKIPATTLSGSMTTTQTALIVDDILQGRYKVLFVSPERLASAAFRRLLRSKFNLETRQYERQFPPVSLLCVDEAHCLSQWGHNFRPSYLRIKSLLPLINPRSVLALTATAGPVVIKDICSTLCIPHEGNNIDQKFPIPLLPSTSYTEYDSGVRVLNCNRDNIDVSSIILENDDQRRYLLYKILKEKKSSPEEEKIKNLPIEAGCLSKGSVIVYVWRKKDTEVVAEQLISAGVLGGIVYYHGGMDANDRTKAQNKFFLGKARICVATVAFGLGINKPDIEGIIHLCLPPSLEHYLQEIGRAGRDGRPAKAIAIPLVDEVISRHSLAHSDRLSQSQLSIVFSKIEDVVKEAIGDVLPDVIANKYDHTLIDELHVALPILELVAASDCKEESVETILSLLGEDSVWTPSLLSVEGSLPDVATITLRKRTLEKLGIIDVIARSIAKCGTKIDKATYYDSYGGTAIDKGFYAYSYGSYKFSVVRCARCLGPNAEPRHVYAALRRLQASGEIELSLDATPKGRGIHLIIRREGIRIFYGTNSGSHNCKEAGGASANSSISTLIAKISKLFFVKEKIGVGKVESIYNIMHMVACQSDTHSSLYDEKFNKPSRLSLFQKLVQMYFSAVDPNDNTTDIFEHAEKAPIVVKEFPSDNRQLLSCLSSDISILMQITKSHPDENIPTAVRITEASDYRYLCLTKVLHGIDAPRAPIREWYSHKLWGKYRDYSFSSMVYAVAAVFEESIKD